MRVRQKLFVFAAAWLAAVTTQAEVRETRDNAFVIEATVTTAASPAAAYTALGKVAAWWDPQHTWSQSSKNLTLPLSAGSCFCEKLAGGGSVQHGRVIFAQPGKLLRLEAALGPLQEMPVTAVLTFKLTPAGAGTQITMSYRVAGAFSLDAAKLAPIVDQVMGSQLERLRMYLDKTPK